MVKVVLADDQELVRTGFRMILRAEADVEVVGEAADGDEAVTLAARLRPDVVLMDIRMPRLDVLAATRKILDNTGGDYFMWWLPGIACVLTILFLITFDIVYCLKIKDWVDYDEADSPWYSFIGHFAIKLWLVIISLFGMFYAGKFAFKRLVLDNQPPEIEKN